MRPSPTPGTAAISAHQTTGMTSSGRFHFADVGGRSGRSSTADASLRSSRLVERSSLPERSVRTHPYQGVQKTDLRRRDSRMTFTLKKYDTHNKDIQDLLECHTAHSYREHECSKHLVDKCILSKPLQRDVSPVFRSYGFVRSTRSQARRILGETDVVDDLEDVPFTAGDIEHFDEKRRMAQQLDKAF